MSGAGSRVPYISVRRPYVDGAFVRSIFETKPRRKTRRIARPELSGPKEKNMLARSPRFLNRPSSAGTPSL